MIATRTNSFVSDTNWLEELQAGDEVIVSHERRGEKDRLATVEHATKTILLVDGVRYNRQGYQTGKHSAWEYIPRLMQATPANQERARRQAAGESVLSWMNTRNRYADDLTLDQWQRIQAIINEGE